MQMKIRDKRRPAEDQDPFNWLPIQYLRLYLKMQKTSSWSVTTRIHPSNSQSGRGVSDALLFPDTKRAEKKNLSIMYGGTQ